MNYRLCDILPTIVWEVTKVNHDCCLLRFEANFEGLIVIDNAIKIGTVMKISKYFFKFLPKFDSHHRML